MSQQRTRPLRRELIRLQVSRRWTPTPPAGAAIVVDTSQAGRPLVQSEVQYTFDSSALPARRMQGACGRRRVELHGGSSYVALAAVWLHVSITPPPTAAPATHGLQHGGE